MSAEETLVQVIPITGGNLRCNSAPNYHHWGNKRNTNKPNIKVYIKYKFGTCKPFKL